MGINRQLQSASWKSLPRTLPLLAVLASGVVARAQDADDFDLGAGMDADGLVAVDMGFAGGEPSPPTAPYQEPVPIPTEPAPGDWYGGWQAWKESLKQRYGTSFELYLNPSAQGIAVGDEAGLARGAIWYNFNLQQTLWTGARAVMNARGGEGEGINPYFDSVFNHNKNTGEATGIYISHLFVEQKLFEERLTIAIGKLDLLDSFDANEVGTWNFIPYSLARNPSIAAPYHALGATVRWDVTEAVYVQAGAADAEGVVTQTGFNTAFDSGEAYFGIYEIGIKPRFFGRPGTYRFIAWHDGVDRDAFVGSSTEQGATGFAISFDQQITDQLGLFCRYGYADPDALEINHYWSIGGTYTGLFPGRENDILGVGIAQAIISSDYRQANGGEPTRTQLDVFYTAKLTPWMSVSPDVQLLINPDESTGDDFLVTATLNVELRF